MKQQQMSPAVAEVARWPTAAECWKVPWQFLDELRSCHNQLEATDPRSAVTSFAQGQAVLESLLLHIVFLSFSLGGAELHLMPSAWGFSCRCEAPPGGISACFEWFFTPPLVFEQDWECAVALHEAAARLGSSLSSTAGCSHTAACRNSRPLTLKTCRSPP